MPTGLLYVPARFCDESHMDGGSSYMYLGALRCSYRRSEIVRERLEDIRKAWKLAAEMKWTKVSRTYLEAYRAWADAFLQDKACRFSVMRVPRSAIRRHGEEGFFTVYKQFLARVVPPTRGCHVWVDGTSLRRRSRWSSLCFRINRSRQEGWNLHGRNISEIHVVDSKEHDIIQLTDVVLGAVACLGTPPQAPAKRCLAEYLASHVVETADTNRGYGAKIWLFNYRAP